MRRIDTNARRGSAQNSLAPFRRGARWRKWRPYIIAAVGCAVLLTVSALIGFPG